VDELSGGVEGAVGAGGTGVGVGGTGVGVGGTGVGVGGTGVGVGGTGVGVGGAGIGAAASPLSGPEIIPLALGMEEGDSSLCCLGSEG